MQRARPLFLLLFLFSGLLSEAQAPPWQWVKCGAYFNDGETIAADEWGNVYLTSANSDTLLIKCDPSGNIIWASGAQAFDTGGGFVNGNTSVGYGGLSADRFGNLYVVGGFNGSFVIIGNDTFAAPEPSQGGAFLVKYDSSGDVLWAQTIQAEDGGGASGVSTDWAGNIYTTGSYTNSVTLGNITLSGGTVFIAKYNPAGVVVWANSSVNNGDADGLAIMADSVGNCYVTGTSATITFGDITVSNTFPPGGNAFTVKYDTDGNAIWASAPTAGNVGSIKSNAVAIDGKGNTYITGTYSGTSEPGNPYIIIGPDTLTTWNGYDSDFFIVKYDSAGNVVWTRTAQESPGSGQLAGLAVHCDPFGNPYVLGWNPVHSLELAIGSDSISLGTPNNPTGFFLVKFDTLGNVIWMTSSGESANRDYHGESATNGEAMTIDNTGAIYVTGGMQPNVSALFGNDTITNPSAGYYYFLGKLDTGLGTATSVQQLGMEEQVLLYPNPCSLASVQLAVGSELIGSRLAVYDIQGQLVFTSQIRNPQSEIPVSGLAAGVYFVQVSSPNGGVVRKLVKI